MLFLADPGLPEKASRLLAGYQREIDGLPDYAERVKAGKQLFGSRNRRSNPAFREVRRALSTMGAGAQRCAYCEDSVGDEVEHIKPKDLYPEAVFLWPNYVYACGPCNGGKNNRYAILTDDGLLDITRRRGAPVVQPADGDPAFIDPRRDDPLALMTMDLLGTFFMLPALDLEGADAERASFTIDTLDLNRDVLLEARANAYGGYRARLFEYCKKRDQGMSADDLAILRNDLLAAPHPTVWEEMVRQSPLLPDIRELFVAVPEARDWMRGKPALV